MRVHFGLRSYRTGRELVSLADLRFFHADTRRAAGKMKRGVIAGLVPAISIKSAVLV
jgi:hypothetical protein